MIVVFFKLSTLPFLNYKSMKKSQKATKNSVSFWLLKINKPYMVLELDFF